jgi:hypothetical protein
MNSDKLRKYEINSIFRIKILGVELFFFYSLFCLKKKELINSIKQHTAK